MNREYHHVGAEAPEIGFDLPGGSLLPAPLLVWTADAAGVRSRWTCTKQSAVTSCCATAPDTPGGST